MNLLRNYILVSGLTLVAVQVNNYHKYINEHKTSALC